MEQTSPALETLLKACEVHELDVSAPLRPVSGLRGEIRAGDGVQGGCLEFKKTCNHGRQVGPQSQAGSTL